MREEWDIYTVNGDKTGRTAYRGDDLEIGEYHLVVTALIKNSSGAYLISRRSEQKKSGSILEMVGGSAVKGDDSLTAIVREIKEELGLTVAPQDLKFVKRLPFETQCSVLFDIWTLDMEVDLDSLTLQEEEVAEVFWLDGQVVKDIILKGEFFNHHIYRELIELGLMV